MMKEISLGEQNAFDKLNTDFWELLIPLLILIKERATWIIYWGIGGRNTKFKPL